MNVAGGTSSNKTVPSRSPCVITSQMFTVKHYSKKQTHTSLSLLVSIVCTMYLCLYYVYHLTPDYLT